MIQLESDKTCFITLVGLAQLTVLSSLCISTKPDMSEGALRMKSKRPGSRRNVNHGTDYCVKCNTSSKIVLHMKTLQIIYQLSTKQWHSFKAYHVGQRVRYILT